MKNPYIYSICAYIAICFLSACSGSNKFVSSFGKRKYIKGYYLDLPSGIQALTVNDIKRQSKDSRGISHSDEIKILPANTFALLCQIVKGPLVLSGTTVRNEQPLIKHIYETVKDTPVTSHKVKYVYINGGWFASEHTEISTVDSFVALIITITAYLLFAFYLTQLIGAGLAGIPLSSAAMALPYIALILDIGAMVFAIITLIKKDEGNKGLVIAVLLFNILLLVLLLYLHL